MIEFSPEISKPDPVDDDLDPYAPPRCKGGSSDRRYRPGVVPFDLGCILSASWAVYRERFVACLGLCNAVLILTVVSQILILRWFGRSPLRRGDPWPLFLGRFGIFFASYVFGTWLGQGQRLSLLALLRSEPNALGRVVHAAGYLLTTLVAGVVLVLLLGSIVLICIFLGTAASAMFGSLAPVRNPAYAAAMLLAFGATAYVAIRCAQFPYLIVDRGAGVIDALTGSWQATRSRVVTLLLVYVLWLAINVGGLLAYRLGVLLTVPFTSLMLAVTYLSLTGQPVVGGKPLLETGDPDCPL